MFLARSDFEKWFMRNGPVVGIIVAFTILVVFIVLLILVLRVKKHKIRFITPDGIKLENIKVKKGQVVHLPIVEMEGLVFKGWFLDSAFTKPAYIQTMPSSNLLLFSKFEKPVIEVKEKPKKEVVIIKEEVKPEVSIEKETKVNLNFRGKLKETSLKNETRFITLTNEFMKYQDTTYRFLKKSCIFKFHGDVLMKIMLVGDLLKVFYKLDPTKYDSNLYHFKDQSKIKSHIDTPLLFNLRSDRAFKYALEFLTYVVEANGLKLRRKIKEYTFNNMVIALKQSPLLKANKSDLLKSKINVYDTDVLSNKETLELLDYKEINVKPINILNIDIDDIAIYFNDGDLVNLETLRTLNLLKEDTDGIRVVGRGNLDKSLIVEAYDFTETAIKMILIAGGKAIKLKETADGGNL